MTLHNLACMTTATTGTGTITLATAATGYLSFADSGVANGETVTYGIVDGNNREIGHGVYSATGTTLTRTVLNSTNSGAPINLSGGAIVYLTFSASDLATLNMSQMTGLTSTQISGLDGSALVGITSTQIAGLGSMAGQSSSSVSISGGTIAASALTGPLPAISGANLTSLVSTQIAGLGSAASHAASDFLTSSSGGVLQASNNLSDVGSVSTAQQNLHMLGNTNQSWTGWNSGGARAFGTVYTNSDIAPRQVCFSSGTMGSAGNFFVYVNGVMIQSSGFGGGSNPQHFSFVVPPGETYEITQTNGTFGRWAELAG